MVALIVFGAIALFVGVVWFFDRRSDGRSTPDGTRWDDPGQAEAHAAAMLSKLRHLPKGP